MDITTGVFRKGNAQSWDSPPDNLPLSMKESTGCDGIESTAGCRVKVLV